MRLSRCDLEMGTFRDRERTVRLVVPFPQWDDFIRLSFDEICTYGATSVQVMRRMSALIADLIPAVPDTRRQALRDWGTRLTATIDRSFVAGEDRQEASIEDWQGLGVPSHVERAAGQGSLAERFNHRHYSRFSASFHTRADIRIGVSVLAL